jgi:hypothetical protein
MNRSLTALVAGASLGVPTSLVLLVRILVENRYFLGFAVPSRLDEDIRHALVGHRLQGVGRAVAESPRRLRIRLRSKRAGMNLG